MRYKAVFKSAFSTHAAWVEKFGVYDPFGDFDLLFSAAALGIGIDEVDISYKARTYGDTNIHRFSDGLKLLRMTVAGYNKFRLSR